MTYKVLLGQYLETVCGLSHYRKPCSIVHLQLFAIDGTFSLPMFPLLIKRYLFSTSPSPAAVNKPGSAYYLSVDPYCCACHGELSFENEKLMSFENISM